MIPDQMEMVVGAAHNGMVVDLLSGRVTCVGTETS